MSVNRPFLLPTLGRHLIREFTAAFLLTLAAFVAIFVIADFFDRFDTFLKHDSSAGTIARYFAFKVPFVVSQVTPFAVLVGGLVGLGLLARHNEFVALRASGVSIWQIAAPLLGLATLVCLTSFAWSEFVVPYCAHRWHTIENVEIRKRGTATLFTGRDVWYHGRAGFYNIDRVSLRRQTLYGLVVYQVAPDFRPERIVEVDLAEWRGTRWRFSGKRTREFTPAGVRQTPALPPGFALPETLEDFGAVSIEPEELSYGMLRRQIRDLRRKGVDTSESLVDLQLKLAFPLASFIMMLVAVPLAASGTRLSSLAVSLLLGVVVGFSYIVVMGLSRALGQGGALPPLLAAWSANALFTLVGAYFLLGAD